MHKIEDLQSTTDPTKLKTAIAAAMADPRMRSVGRILRAAGLDAMAAPMTEYEVDAKLATAGKSLEPVDRIALKTAMSRVGLMTN